MRISLFAWGIIFLVVASVGILSFIILKVCHFTKNRYYHSFVENELIDSKKKVNSKNDVYIRISQEAINVILDKVLGKNNRRFDISEVSELEARVITSFNDFLYETLSSPVPEISSINILFSTLFFKFI